MENDNKDSVLENARAEGVVILERYKSYKRRLRIYRGCLCVAIFISVMTIGFFGYRYFYNKIPGVLRVKAGEEKTEVDFGMFVTPGAPTATANGYSMQVNLLGFLPLKEVDIQIIDDRELIPCGIPVGLYVEFQGILVTNVGEFTGYHGKTVSPAKGILQEGDYILGVNGYEIGDKEDFVKTIAESCGTELALTFRRGKEVVTKPVKAVQDENGEYKLGIWLRDNAQGIGTMTYIDSRGNFGALGHALGDMDTSTILDVEDGALLRTRIIDIKKGKKGDPGELTGTVTYADSYVLGDVDYNGNTGIFGNCNAKGYSMVEAQPLPIGLKQDIRLGDAYVYCTVRDKPEYFDIEITGVELENDRVNRGIELTITDPELLEITGGIVQGLSGSPIIQDGKIIGAVTHVLIDDPDKGFGIFIETMLTH